MVNILEISPFGFIFEIVNNFPFCIEEKYEVFLNNNLKTITNKNVISFYDLKPNLNYEIIVKINDSEIEKFIIKTLNCSFLINIKDYNAFGDGICDDTSAINVAIYSANPGSTIYFPKGIYLVDQILLKSNINLFFDNEAIIKQNTNRNKMSILKGLQKNYYYTDSYINTTWEGNPLDSYCSLIYAKNICNVKIFGNGILDGNGEKSGFWENVKDKNITYRPKNIELVNCENISICGLKSLNSSCWNIHTLFSQNINFYDLFLESLETSPNTDGINPECSKEINIIGCYFSVGDDCIAIKSGKYYMSQYFYVKSENITIRNCYMQKGHGGVVIGSEISCGASNINVSNCIFTNNDRCIRIKTRRGRGIKSVISNLNVSNCKMSNVKHCLTINMFYSCDPDGKSDYVKNKNITKKDEFTPTIHNIKLVKITANNITGCAIFVFGLPENPVNHIKIIDSEFLLSDYLIDEVPEMLEDFPIYKNLGLFIENAFCDFVNTNFIGNFNSIIK